jgi:hypothetical protein
VSPSESNENSALELKLDIDELHEVHALCVRLPIRNYLSHLIIQLEKVRTSSPCCLTSNLNEERKWSDVVAGRNTHASGTNTSAIHNIETVITSGPSHLRIGTQGMDTNKNIQPTNNKRNSNKIVLMNIDNQPNSNPITIANIFNAYFSSVASKLISKLPGNGHPAHEDPINNITSNFKTPSSLRFKHTTTYEVNSIIQSLKTKDSCGYDEISPRILKVSAPYTLSPLTDIFNKILSTGIFPERLKFSEIGHYTKKDPLLNFQI